MDRKHYRFPMGGQWSLCICLVLLISAALAVPLETGSSNTSIPVRYSDRRSKALKLSKKPCTDPSGWKGECTFKWECINRNGTLMGTCVDGFIFGTCCRYDNQEDHDIDIDTNAIVEGQVSLLTLKTTTIASAVTETRTPPPTTTVKIPLTLSQTAQWHTSRLTTAKPPATPLKNQLVTWTSIGPTVRPIIIQPFRPPGMMGVAFPIATFQGNRPFQIYRPPFLAQQGSVNNVVNLAPSVNASSSFSILNGPDKTSIEHTTVSVPIPQWSTSKTTTVESSTTSSTVFSSTTNSTALKTSLDYKKDCGVRTIGSKARIVGGQSARFGRWPWQALVKEAAWLGLYQKNKCGGVLVSSRHVLTAGHCQPGRFLSALVVILGEFDLLTETEALRPEMRRVRRMIVHRNYDPRNFDNDLAILELDTPVRFQPHIAPICLPEAGEDFTGRTAYVTGWGKTQHGGSIPNLLQEVQVPIMSNSRCIDMFKEAGHAKLIKDTFLCAGYLTGGKDSCEGDSGGPLMLERPSGQWVLAGTVSHGIRCADPNLPGVYVRISAYRSWIDRIVQ